MTSSRRESKVMCTLPQVVVLWTSRLWLGRRGCSTWLRRYGRWWWLQTFSHRRRGTSLRTLGGLLVQNDKSRINIMAQGLSTADPSLSPTHLSIMTGRATTTHYTHHQVSLMVLRTTLVLSLGLCIEPACEAGLSAGMWRERVPPQRRKRKKKGSYYTCAARHCAGLCRSGYCCSDKSRFCLLVILQGSAHTHIRWGHEFLYHTFKHSLLQLHDKIYSNV